MTSKSIYMLRPMKAGTALPADFRMAHAHLRLSGAEMASEATSESPAGGDSAAFSDGNNWIWSTTDNHIFSNQ